MNKASVHLLKCCMDSPGWIFSATDLLLVIFPVFCFLAACSPSSSRFRFFNLNSSRTA